METERYEPRATLVMKNVADVLFGFKYYLVGGDQ